MGWHDMRRRPLRFEAAVSDKRLFVLFRRESSDRSLQVRRIAGFGSED
jgi:hypothetical protein